MSTDIDSTVQFIIILVIPPHSQYVQRNYTNLKKNLPNCTERHGILNYLLGV